MAYLWLWSEKQLYKNLEVYISVLLSPFEATGLSIILNSSYNGFPHQYGVTARELLQGSYFLLP